MRQANLRRIQRLRRTPLFAARPLEKMSMNDNAFVNTVGQIHQNDPRYDEEAYFFIRDALDFSAKALSKPRSGPDKHISGTELVECVREFALQEFGPMTYTVLTAWGIEATSDFGEIVFNLVDAGMLGKTDEDRKEDFASKYDFVEAFVKPFLPGDPSSREVTRSEDDRHPS